MATTQRKAGIIQLSVDGVRYDAKGDFTYNLGAPKRDSIIGADGQIHGFKETAQEPFIEGEITDNADLDLALLVNLDGATITLSLANGKTIALNDAWYAGDGTGNTGEGNIAVRFVGKHGEEVL